MNWLFGTFSWLWREPTRQRLYRLLPLGILFLAAVLRFHWLDHQSLWNDEGNSLRLAQRAIPDLIATARLDIHPPGYYLALKAWIALVGDSEFGLRSLSAFLGVLSVALTYALGKKLFAQGVGVVASLLVAVNTFNIYYSQEARMYAALAAIAAAAMWYYVRWLERPTWRNGLALAVLNTLGLYTQYAYPAVMLTQGVMFVVWWISRRPRFPLTPAPSPRKDGEGENQRTLSPSLFTGEGLGWGNLLLRYIGLNLITIALFAPQIGTAVAQISVWPRTGEAIGSGAAIIIQWMLYGNTTTPMPLWAYLWPALFLLAALFPDWLRYHRLPSWWRRLLPWIWLLLTVGPLFGLGLFRTANLKLLLPAQIAAALLVGRGIWLLWEIGSPNMFLFVEALPRMAAGLGLLSTLSIANDVVSNLYIDPAYARPDYHAIAHTIAYTAHPSDAIVLDAPNQQEVFTYYYHDDTPIYPLPRGLGGDDAATAKEISGVIAQHQRIYLVYWGETERDPNRIVEKTLTAQAFQVDSSWYGDVRLVQYATLPKTTAAPITLNAQFGDAITLASATLTATTIHPGDALGVTLDWSTSQRLDRHYKVFVQLVDSSGKLIALSDSEPANYLAPTTTWQPGQSITDTHGIAIPAATATGDYTLIAGMYDADSSQRLPVAGSDHVTLATIRVSP